MVEDRTPADEAPDPVIPADPVNSYNEKLPDVASGATQDDPDVGDDVDDGDDEDEEDAEDDD